ncbi:Hsp20/alpha crystallin family protein [Salinisphaera sp. LB1]|uniref:Hsp20/alpha crystallin family protein n=1 Tax=Salinisphaera sp. LB1 TaxID=2183911 RepID=UPI000D708041|nr:Hsp20/alpha crystallin family protein [Salinisphaera sp. LB1]AWN17187.1 Heat shock protein, Hsp20 family [Salinisphaera sp. LB1]
MAIQRYEPSTLLQQFNDEINRMFYGQADDVPAVSGGNWRPAIDIHENEQSYVIDAELPGINPKDIEITLRNGVLTLSGERSYHYDSAQDNESNAESASRREPARLVERRYGRFVRRFTLPDTADEDAIDARADNGVLKITVPKKAQSQPRRIEVASDQ